MIKLVDLLNELDKPEQMYVSGFSPENYDMDFLKKGYRMTGTTIDPETGKSTSNVEQVADFKRISNMLGEMLQEIRPLRGLIGEQPYIKTIRTQSAELVEHLNKAQALSKSLKGYLKRIQS